MLHQTATGNTLGGDETVGVAEGEGFTRAEQLDSGEPNFVSVLTVLVVVVAFSDVRRQWDDEGDIVARVHPHHLACSHRPVQPLDPPIGVLYHQSHRIYCLAVSHPSFPEFRRMLKKYE